MINALQPYESISRLELQAFQKNLTEISSENVVPNAIAQRYAPSHFLANSDSVERWPNDLPKDNTVSDIMQVYRGSTADCRRVMMLTVQSYQDQ